MLRAGAVCSAGDSEASLVSLCFNVQESCFFAEMSSKKRTQ